MVNKLLGDIIIQQALEQDKLLNYLRYFENLRKNLKKSWIDDLGNPILNGNINLDESLPIDGTLLLKFKDNQKIPNTIKTGSNIVLWIFFKYTGV